MARPVVVCLFGILILLSPFALTQNPPASDPQALAYASQSIAVVTGGTAINDITLTGNATWNQADSGSATLKALGTGESRMDLALSSGNPL